MLAFAEDDGAVVAGEAAFGGGTGGVVDLAADGTVFVVSVGDVPVPGGQGGVFFDGVLHSFLLLSTLKK